MKTRLSQGSALIITMLVVTAIATAAFGLSRIFLADLRISSALEDSTHAFYIAEAGLEEGLLRYRIDRNNQAGLNVLTDQPRPLSIGGYTLSTTFYTTMSHSAKPELTGFAHSFDTTVENNSGFPAGAVPQDETVEISLPAANVGDIEVAWRWQGGVGPSNAECGVQVTPVQSDGGTQGKVKSAANATRQVSAYVANRVALRVKPLCRGLDWLGFGSSQALGRTVQTIEATGTVGKAKRKLQSTVSRQSGSIVGFFDFVIGCGIVAGDCPDLNK